MKVRGFKAMNKDMTCRYFQFEIGKTYLHDGKVIPCESGFHFCEKIEDVFNYYNYNCRIFEVEADDIIIKDGDKTVTNNLTILNEIDYNQYVDYVDNNEYWKMRTCIASNGFGLGTTLVNDPDWHVRREVAKQGYGLDVLINDPDPYVRIEVARHGYGLDVLINDPDCDVRIEVAEHGYGLDILVNDIDWSVRCAVAKQGYGLDVLVNDPDCDVRREVAIKIKEII